MKESFSRPNGSQVPHSLYLFASCVFFPPQLSEENTPVPSQEVSSSRRFSAGVAVCAVLPGTGVHGAEAVGGSAVAQAHCPDGGGASGLPPQGVLTVSGHLWPLCEEEMEVECVNVIKQGKRTD